MINKRLREERMRLGLSQIKMATHCGVLQQAQYLYEKGANKPNSEYFERASVAGVDVLYVLTGKRDEARLSDEEFMVLDQYRSAPDVAKKLIKQMLASVQEPIKPSRQVKKLKLAS